MQEQIKALKRDQPARRSDPALVRFDNPDDAAEAGFATATDARRGASDHAECDAEIGRREAELAASERHKADLKTIVGKLEATNGDLASRLITATNMPDSKPAAAARPAMSRAQRREAEREAKRRRRRS